MKDVPHLHHLGRACTGKAVVGRAKELAPVLGWFVVVIQETDADPETRYIG
jgi:hypothetical protein